MLIFKAKRKLKLKFKRCASINDDLYPTSKYLYYTLCDLHIKYYNWLNCILLVTENRLYIKNVNYDDYYIESLYCV